MKRRGFITLASGAAAASMGAPPPVAAQQPAMPVIGFLGLTAPAPKLVAPFLAGLAAAGFSDGRNVAIQYRWADNDTDRLPVLVADLLRNPVAVIVTIGGTGVARAAKAATTSVPIVFEVGADPVTTGLVASLNRPDGNLTGVSMLTAMLNPKRLEMLHEIVPSAATIAVLVGNATGAQAQSNQNEIRSAAAAMGVQAQFVRAGTEREIEAAFTSVIEQRIGALLVSSNPLFNSRREQLAALAMRHSLPAIFEWREFTAIGGLMSYGTDISDVHRQLGDYAARILKGAKPADLPIIQPTRFELVINLRTAKALGLTVPPALLARADELIE